MTYISMKIGQVLELGRGLGGWRHMALRDAARRSLYGRRRAASIGWALLSCSNAILMFLGRTAGLLVLCHLSNADSLVFYGITCLIHIIVLNLLHHLPLLKNTCVRQVVLDK